MKQKETKRKRERNIPGLQGSQASGDDPKYIARNNAQDRPEDARKETVEVGR